MTTDAIETIQAHLNRRTHRTATLREFRGEWRAIKGVIPRKDYIKWRNGLVRSAVAKTCYGEYFKPTRKNFVRLGMEALVFSRSPLPFNRHDTEYYSACGIDDMHGEQRDDALNYAIHCAVCAAYLRN